MYVQANVSFKNMDMVKKWYSSTNRVMHQKYHDKMSKECHRINKFTEINLGMSMMTKINLEQWENVDHGELWI